MESAPNRAKKSEALIQIEEIKKAFFYTDGKLYRKSTGKAAGSKHHTGYWWVSFGDKKLSYSRAVWAYHKNKFPDGVIDHINGVISDNRIENLRDVSERENALNTKKTRNGHFPGVCYRNGTAKRNKRWRAFAPAKFLNRDEPKKKLIGSFLTKEEAIAAVVTFCSMPHGVAKDC